MFQSNSIIQEVNIINKVICYVLVIVALILCKEPVFILFVHFFLSLITKPFPKLWKVNICFILIAVVSVIFPQILWISKLGILVLYTVLLKKVTELKELRYLLESSLYRFQSKKITYHILYLMYFGKYWVDNMNKMHLLRKNYQMKFSMKWLIFSIQNSYWKTKKDMKDFLEIYQLRFYHYSNNRTYINKPVWENWDMNYLFSHVIIFFLTFFYGR